MNTLPIGQAESQQWGDSAGGDGIGAVANSPAQPSYTVGSIQFRNTQLPAELADEVMEQMADSIVELTHQLEEANARVAVLEEGQKILGKLADARASHLNQVCEELGMGDGYIAVDAAIMAAAKIKRLEETVESLRDDACRESCRDKAAADGNWVNC